MIVELNALSDDRKKEEALMRLGTVPLFMDF